MTAKQQHYEVVVIGAGFAGLISAHRYLCLHPTASLVIIDRNANVGGTWSHDRVYPGFYAQLVVGLAEFSDLKMKDPAQEDCVGDCFKAKCMTEYLEEFAEKMVHDGKSLRDRYLRAIVTEVRRCKSEKEGEWEIDVSDVSGTDSGDAITTRCITTQKLIVGTGEFSTPNIPRFSHQATFGAPIIHSTYFGQSNILSTPNINHVAILGAGKSAADILYTCLKSLPTSTKVHWIISDKGTGPGLFAPMDIPSPYKNAVESSNTMAMSLLQPSFYHEDGWWVWFFHKTWLGIWLVTWIFGNVDAEAKKRAAYHTRGKEATERGFDKLEFEIGVFWPNTTISALHHKDFWDVVAPRVIVHRARITSLSHHSVQLSNDTAITCDALLLGTGFETSLSIFSDELKAELGLPHDPVISKPEVEKRWTRMDAEADIVALQRFPNLANPPKHFLRVANTTPYRLHRGIVPLSDTSRSIVFINFLISGNMMMNAEAQAMWAVAYLSSPSVLQLPSSGEMERTVAMQVAWCKRRYLSNGQLGNYAGFDTVVYTDTLLKDLGVEEPWRAKGAWGVRRPEDLGKAWKKFLLEHDR